MWGLIRVFQGRAVDALREQGLTVREIAAATGMKEHTAHQRLHRSRR